MSPGGTLEGWQEPAAEAVSGDRQRPAAVAALHSLHLLWDGQRNEVEEVLGAGDGNQRGAHWLSFTFFDFSSFRQQLPKFFLSRSEH